MNIHELDSYNLGDAVKFHRRLNPRIWGRDEHLLPEVREKLLTIAADFQEFLGVEDLNIQDITISGSNAAYSYTKNSDIDLHLVVKMPDDPIYQELFNAKKYQYNDEHNIRIGGADVELYVQPADQPHHSQGIYSIKDNEWRQVPQRKRAQIDDACVRDKVADLDARIHAAVKSHNLEAISALWNKIKAMRQAGLEQHGEFGCGNISFKMLRNSGCIRLLKDAMMAQKDRELSLRETPAQPFRYGYGTEVDEASLADMRAAFAVTDAQPAKQEVFRSPYEYEKVKKQREAERQEKIAKIARKPVKPWTGGVEEGMQSQPYSTSDGVAATTKEFLEDAGTDNDLVHDFIQHTATELGIDPLPKIHLHTDPAWSTSNHSFGRYDPDTHTLNISMPNRHILDVLRTVAHELVHCSQNQQHGHLPDDAGETGSDWENDANARAGIIMRDWANTHPEHFEMPALGEGASGYIPKNKKEAAMPQYAMALSVDIKPGEVGRQANKLALHTGRNGEPGLLMKTVNLRESAGDYQIRNTEKLDRVLAKCCGMIEHGQQKNPDRYGMVAACVIDPDNRMIASTSVNHNGRWIHAERMAINKYHKRHGDIPAGSIVVTTCSPCNSPMDDRAGESCKDLLNSVGIHKVYCGYIDPTQHDDEDADFTVGLTQNDDLWKACKAFADTFLHEDVRVWENFADGRHPEDKGDSKRHGIPKKASLTQLDKIGHGSGRKAQLARWQANMRRGRAK
jgi:pyrimidine deaminase RibD-like protein